VSTAPRRVADAWTPDQLERRAQAERGQCVVANERKGADAELIAWAKAKGCFVYIGRGARGYPAGVWTNTAAIIRQELQPDRPAHMRAVAAYARWLSQRPELFARIPELRGMVLGCWCHPLPCHGHLLVELANRSAIGEGIASRWYWHHSVIRAYWSGIGQTSRPHSSTGSRSGQHTVAAEALWTPNRPPDD
jgi:hypothetical protein